MPSPSDLASRPLREDPAAQDKRNRELSRLLPLWPSEIADTSLEGRRRLVAVGVLR